MRPGVFMLLILLLLGCVSMKPTIEASDSSAFSRPKLIIGITVDQMRYDYIDKYWADFGENGFRRLVGDGFFCRNLRYNYMPTFTGPGHASIFTGTTPSYHGIIQNDWYERSSGKMIYCSADSMVAGVGTSSNAGKMSPHYLSASTIGDAMEMFFNERSKVYGIAMKDRGAILPAGRTADGAYWFVGGDEGVWVSSSWYMSVLPPWVIDFNSKGRASNYMNQTWDLYRDVAAYDESAADNNAHESPFRGTLKPVFPYKLSELRAQNGNFDLIKATPFGNDLTIDFAKSLIHEESMGSDEFTDMLCMSFSSTDYIGHQFGLHSMENQDCYLRLDYQIAEFLKFLDEEVGNGNYLIFLSADHGGAPTPSYVMKQNASAGYWKSDAFEEYLESQISVSHGAGDWILNESNQNIFLNKKLISEKKLELKKIQQEVAALTLTYSEVLQAFTGFDLGEFTSGNRTREMVMNGFNQSLSGDVIYVLKPGYMEYGMTGTTHGSPFNYDSHVPAIFFGAGVNAGESFEPFDITDIAPTVAAICRLPLPDACTGKPITDAIHKIK